MIIKEPFESCPHFEGCQVNDCPLARKPNKFKTMPQDKLLYGYHKCRATKKLRMRIAKEYGLESLGLTRRELSGMKKSLLMKQQAFSTQTNEPESSQTTLVVGKGEKNDTNS